MVAGILRLLLEGVSVVCVGLGFFLAMRQALRLRGSRQPRRRWFNSVRLSFGSWLSMALEFQLAADIVATTTSPSNENLLKLAVVAVIRTFLNVFLGREVEAEQVLEDAQRTQGTDLPKIRG